MPESYPVCSSRWLVLDDRVIEEVVEAKLTLGEITKHPQNPLFGEDKPWEPRFDNVYANVIYDTEDRLYKCWYNPFIIDKRVTHTPLEKQHPDWCNYMDVKPSDREMAVCYAFSVRMVFTGRNPNSDSLNLKVTHRTTF